MSEGALPILEREICELLRVRGIDPPLDGMDGVRQVVDEVLDDYATRMCTSALPSFGSRKEATRYLVDRVAGLGPLQRFMDDPDVEELWINGPGKVFCARDGRRELTGVVLDPAQVRDLVEKMLRPSGRRLDLSSPFVDASLADGSRLHVAIPDVTRKHWAVNIRKFVAKATRLEQLVTLGSVTPRAADFLSRAVKAGLNLVVSGGTQTGKTTMLNCLAGAIPAEERVVTCEEVFELQVLLPDVVAMQTRQMNLEGHGEIPLRRLIVEALRMRPDRILVGEVREREALDLLIALNSGLPGMTSIHSNSATEALTKLTTLPLLAGENVTHGFVVPTVASCVDIVVHLGRQCGSRVVQEIVGVSGRVEGDRIETVTLFERSSGDLCWTGHQPPFFDRSGLADEDLRGALA